MFSPARALAGLSRIAANIASRQQSPTGRGRSSPSPLANPYANHVPSGQNIQSGVMHSSAAITNPPGASAQPNVADSHSGRDGHVTHNPMYGMDMVMLPGDQVPTAIPPRPSHEPPRPPMQGSAGGASDGARPKPAGNSNRPLTPPRPTPTEMQRAGINTQPTTTPAQPQRQRGVPTRPNVAPPPTQGPVGGARPKQTGNRAPVIPARPTPAEIQKAGIKTKHTTSPAQPQQQANIPAAPNFPPPPPPPMQGAVGGARPKQQALPSTGGLIIPPHPGFPAPQLPQQNPTGYNGPLSAKKTVTFDDSKNIIIDETKTKTEARAKTKAKAKAKAKAAPEISEPKLLVPYGKTLMLSKLLPDSTTSSSELQEHKLYIASPNELQSVIETIADNIMAYETTGKLIRTSDMPIENSGGGIYGSYVEGCLELVVQTRNGFIVGVEDMDGDMCSIFPQKPSPNEESTSRL